MWEGQKNVHSSVHRVFLRLKMSFCAACTVISSGKTHNFWYISQHFAAYSGDVRLRMNYECSLAKRGDFVNFFGCEGDLVLSTDFVRLLRMLRALRLLCGINIFSTLSHWLLPLSLVVLALSKIRQRSAGQNKRGGAFYAYLNIVKFLADTGVSSEETECILAAARGYVSNQTQPEEEWVVVGRVPDMIMPPLMARDFHDAFKNDVQHMEIGMRALQKLRLWIVCPRQYRAMSNGANKHPTSRWYTNQ